MNAGRRRHRVDFLEPVATVEANGSEAVNYVSRFTRWAAVEPIKGAEALRSSQPLGVMDTRILVDWSAAMDTVTEKWRAAHRGALYDLVSVVNPGMLNREIEFMCKSGAVS